MINWQLISHPGNWLIVFLMLAIAGVGITLINGSIGGSSDAS
jgi:hypothetical protein